MITNRRVLGIAITCVAFFAYTVMDGILKWLGPRVPVMEQFAGTACVSALILFAIGSRAGTRLVRLRTGNIKLHCLRATLFLGEFCLCIYSFNHIPLASFYTLIFTAPLFVTLLSALFLKETIGWRSWIATLAGFGGVLVDLRPGHELSLYSLCTLVAAVLFSSETVLMRIANRRDSAISTMFYVNALSFMPACLYVAAHFQPVAMQDLAWLVLCGALLAIAQVTLVTGFRLATNPVAAPFHYTQLIWGVAIGWAVWGDLPDLWTWTGAAVIAGSGLYVLRREALNPQPEYQG